MIRGHSGAHAPPRNMRASLGQMNRYGQTQPIHPKHGLYRHSKSQLSTSLVQIRRPSTIIFRRSAFVLSMPLDCSKADFSHCLSSESKSTCTRSIFGLSCGFDAVSSSTILYCKLKLGKMIGSGERNWDQREGAEHRRWQEEAETESEDDLDALELARCRLMTSGQKF